MAVDGGLGPRRQPKFLDGGFPDIAVDPTAVADYAAEFGNHVVDTNAKRLTATSWAWAGLTWYCTDTKVIWVYEAGAWRVIIEDTGPAAPTLLNGWVNFGAPYALAGYTRVNGFVILSGTIKDGILTSGTNLFVLPPGFRPGTIRRFFTISGTIASVVQIDPSGTVAFSGNAFANSSVALDSIPPFRAEA